MFIDFYNRGGGSGGGVTTGQVATMIENKQNLYTATTLSDITSPKEGDVACIITTASSSTSSWEDFSVDNLADDMEAETFWGRTFKFDYTGNPMDFQLFVGLEDENNQEVYYGVGCDYLDDMYDWYQYSGDTVPQYWDGSETTITFPEDDGTLTFNRAYLINADELAQEGALSIQEYVETTTVTSSSTQYSYVNGQWVETGTGSGGEKFVELTKAQYEALTGYAEDTTYIITDAPSIDLNTLATTGQVETKADKASVTANTGRAFPKWNTQGIITGSTGNSVYEQSLNINGTSKTMLQTTNSSFGNIYAPTSAGSAGQILQSNGSGAPVWSTFKMWYGNQTQYDAITTKDNNTIYFVTDD